MVQLRLTNLCNLRCSMCGQWGETGIYCASSEGSEAGDGEPERARIRELIGKNRQLALAEYLELLDQIAPFDPVVSLFGGEPFLYPEFMELVRAVKDRGLLLTAITNGWHLEQRARELVEAGMDSIAISIDGTEQLHNRIRKSPQSFARLAAGLRALEHWRRERGRPLPMTIAILPLTEHNIDELREAMEALSRLPLDVINIGLRWWIPPEVGQQYERVMKESFGVSGDSWRGFLFRWPEGDGERLERLVHELVEIKRQRVWHRARGRPWVSFLPALAPQQVPTYFTEFAPTFGHELCPAPWYFAQVEPDGRVCFCGDFPDYSIGNVRDASFSEIWHGEAAGRFRDKLAREPLPTCNRCCSNFAYGRWKRPKGDPR